MMNKLLVLLKGFVFQGIAMPVYNLFFMHNVSYIYQILTIAFGKLKYVW